MTGWIGPLTYCLLSSTPSTENPLNRGRPPPTDPPDPSTPPGCEVVLGARTANSLTSPPKVPSGNSLATRPLNVALNSEDSTFTTSAPASTSTTADTSPISSSAVASAT